MTGYLLKRKKLRIASAFCCTAKFTKFIATRKAGFYTQKKPAYFAV